MSNVALPFISPKRTVVLIADDGASVYSVSSRSVKFIETVPWRGGNFSQALAGVLDGAAGGAQVLFVNDMVEQYYRKERVPKTSTFDQSNVIARRLNVAFPGHAALAYKPLKESKAEIAAKSSEKGVAGSPYLFAAVPNTSNYSYLVDAVSKATAGVSGYALLPAESSDLANEFSTKLAKERRGKTKSAWSILITQHESGGLRQIVTRNGELALTRITPISAPDVASPEVWAGEVAAEFQATLGYLSRFGYTQDQGLDVILVANSAVGSVVEDMIMSNCNFRTFNLQQAASYVGVPLGRTDEQHYGDALHVAWIGRKLKFSMPMASRELDKYAKPRKAANIAGYVLALGIGYFAFSSVGDLVDIYAASSNLKEVVKQREEIEQIYQAEIKKKESMGIDIKLVQSSLAIEEDMIKNSVNPLPIIEAVSRQLQNLRLKKFDMDIKENVPDPNAPPADPNAPPPQPEIAFTLTLEFPGTTAPERGNKDVGDLQARLQKSLTSYDVTVVKELEDLSYSGKIEQEVGITAQQRRPEEVYTAEIQIVRKKVANE